MDYKGLGFRVFRVWGQELRDLGFWEEGLRDFGAEGFRMKLTAMRIWGIQGEFGSTVPVK